MGRLVDGVWETDRSFPTGKDGAFERPTTRFRNWITRDGAPGPSGRGGFTPDPGRYRLYVSLACPWAHRTLIVRALKGLAGAIAVSVVNPLMGEDGWTFLPDRAVVPDPDGATFLREVYLRADPRASGSVTVPVLWDTRTRTIVSNESGEIIRMLDDAFESEAPPLHPPPLRDEIEAVNARVYRDVNNGVYRAGFAASQGAYEAAFASLFAALDWLEARLSDGRPFLVGDQLTLADIRLFTTLVRFDAVYHGHFKCNRNRLVDFPALWAHTRRIHAIDGVAGTVDLDHIKRHYYGSHPDLNPRGIVPVGPAIDFGPASDPA